MTMRYVQRDETGAIIATFANPQPQTDGSFLTDPEPLPEEGPDLTKKTLAEAMAGLAAEYKADAAALYAAWLSASVLSGATEEAKKAGVSSALAERKTQYISDIAALRAAYS